jgi:hypothetical protein
MQHGRVSIIYGAPKVRDKFKMEKQIINKMKEETIIQLNIGDKT